MTPIRSPEKPAAKLVIGYDGSAYADEAIDDLKRAGLPERNVDAHVVSIADVWPLPPGEQYAKLFPKATADSRARTAQAMHEAEEHVSHGCQRLIDLHPYWAIGGEACADSPHWGLIGQAHARRADLIVVGSHGRSALGRLYFGSVSHSVALYADGSVRVGRISGHRQPADKKELRILIGWDNSSGAQWAIEAVVARAWPADTKIRVVTVIDTQLVTAMPFIYPTLIPVNPSFEPKEPVLIHQEIIRNQAQSMLARLGSSGLEVEFVLLEGSPKHLLLRQAEEWGADGIFLGARGLGRVQRMLLGSVSAGVVAQAPCSVEVVRR